MIAGSVSENTKRKRINNMFIGEDIFSKVRDILKSIGFREKYPIYATGGYVSYILKNKDFFCYITKIYKSK